MANNLNATKIAQTAFIEALASATEDYLKCGQQIETSAGQLQLGNLAAGGIASEVTAAATSVSASNMASNVSTINAQGWALKHTVPWHMLDRDFTLAEQAGVKLANAAAQNVNKQYFDGLEGLFTTNHPAANAGVGGVGAGKHFCDTGLAFLQTEAGAGTQDNKITSAFSEASVDTCLQLMQNYKDQRGLPLNIGANGGLVLVVAPKNRKAAHELAYSTLSGADMQANTMRSWIKDVVCYPFSTDDDDFFVIDPMMSPTGIWMTEKPLITLNSSDDGLFAIFTARWQSAFYIRASEAGIVGSNVA